MKRHSAGECTIDIFYDQQNECWGYVVKLLTGRVVYSGAKGSEADALSTALSALVNDATRDLQEAEQALESAQYAKIWAQSQLDDIAKIKEENGL